METIGSFQKPYWTINARVVLRDNQNNNVNDRTLLDRLVVQTKPEPFYTVDDNVSMSVPEGASLPYVIFAVPNFGRKTINLKELASQITIDNYYKTITIREPVIIPKD